MFIKIAFQVVLFEQGKEDMKVFLNTRNTGQHLECDYVEIFKKSLIKVLSNLLTFLLNLYIM